MRNTFRGCGVRGGCQTGRSVPLKKKHRKVVSSVRADVLACCYAGKWSEEKAQEEIPLLTFLLFPPRRVVLSLRHVSTPDVAKLVVVICCPATNVIGDSSPLRNLKVAFDQKAKS